MSPGIIRKHFSQTQLITMKPASPFLKHRSCKIKGQTAALAVLMLATSVAHHSAAQAQTASTGPIQLQIDASKNWVNVMKTATPTIPAFQALQVKPGFVRGFVKDIKGKPLQNAHLGVRATAVGGYYSGAQGKTDARGYYEIRVPAGAVHFYNAGYTIDYGEGRAALGLHPADGDLNSFASQKGNVENFVALPYGITNRDKAQDQPHYSGNYYGGYLYLDWTIADENPTWVLPGDIPANSEIVVTLTPQASIYGGLPGRQIVIRKNIANSSQPQAVLNLPITTYKLSAKLADGTPLKLKETGPRSSSAFGIEPKQGAASADLQFRPNTAQAAMAGAGLGSWDTVSVKLSR